MDWTAKKAEEAQETLRKWSSLASECGESDVDEEIIEALCEDLNTWESLTRLEELFSDDDRTALNASAKLLGFDLQKIAESDWAKPFHYEAPDGRFLEEGVDYQPTVGVIGWGEISDNVRDASLSLVHRWLSYRRVKDWENADRLKSEAALVGIELRASRSKSGVNGGTANLSSNRISPSKLEALK